MVAPATACRSCGAADLTTVVEQHDIPVANSLLLADADAARSVVCGDLLLQRCEVCGFVQNSRFDESVMTYDDDYESSQSHSPHFVAFADRIIDELADTYDLRGGRALEIGCGRGEFLERYVDRVGGTGVGLDPAAGVGSHSDTVEIRPMAFGPGSGHFDADVVLCRHTLEHIPDAHAFLTMLRREFDGRPDTVIFIEVPDSGRIAREGAFWDVYYEHCSYVDEDSLTDLLTRTGFEIEMTRLDYDGQYLLAVARPSGLPSDTVTTRSDMDFSTLVDNVAAWSAWAADRRTAGDRVALWAASSKAVALLSSVPELEPAIAVDINPAKAGRFLPASAIAVVDPEGLVAIDPDAVLLMNPVYRDEVVDLLGSLDLTPTMWAMGERPEQC